MAERNQTNVKDPMGKGKEERENQIAIVTGILKDENDEELVESLIEVVQQLQLNPCLREGLKRFHKNGWAFIQKSKKDSKVEDEEGLSSTSTSALMRFERKESLQSRLELEAHPLDNDLVLKRVFEFSSVKDLKSCRLVSKKWRDLSLSSWRRKAVLRLDNIWDQDEIEPLFRGGSQFRDTPFINCKVNYSPDNFDFDTKKTLLEKYGSSIQNLYLSSTDMETMFSLLSTLPDLCVVSLKFDIKEFLKQYKSIISEGRKCPFQEMQPSTSKLRELELKLIMTVGNDHDFDIDDIDFDLEAADEPNVTFPWKKIFANTPALKSLRVKYHIMNPAVAIDMSLSGTIDDIMHSVSQVRKEANFSTLVLEELDIIYTQHPYLVNQLTEDFVTSITECQLPLQKLTIRLGINPNPATISNLLENHAETLKYLKCDGDLDKKYLKKDVLKLPLELSMPSKISLPNLQEIVFLTGCVWAFHVLPCLEIPCLEVLKIKPKKKPLYETEAGEQIDLKDLKSLDGEPLEIFSGASLPNIRQFFYDGPRDFSAIELLGLAKAMPNVTDLGIPLGGDENGFPIIPKVYEIWPGLESLHIVTSDITYLLFDDYAITGLPPFEGNNNDKVCGEPIHSNITNLKNLSKFVLETRLAENFHFPRRSLITDISAVYGFLQLPKLRVLQLETLCEFSPKIMAALEAHVIEIKIKRPESCDDARDSDADSEHLEAGWDDLLITTSGSSSEDDDHRSH